MASFQELADGYVHRLRRANDESAEVKAVAQDINNLKYAGTGEPISSEGKQKIIDLVQRELTTSKRSEGVVGILKEADNKRYLQLVQSLRALTKANP